MMTSEVYFLPSFKLFVLAVLNPDLLILRFAVILMITSEVYFLPSFKLHVLVFLNPDLLILRSATMITREFHFLPSSKLHVLAFLNHDVLGNFQMYSSDDLRILLSSEHQASCACFLKP